MGKRLKGYSAPGSVRGLGRQRRRCFAELLEVRRPLSADAGLEKFVPLHQEVVAGDNTPAAIIRSPDSAAIHSPAQVVEFDPRTRTELVRPLEDSDTQLLDSLNKAAQTEGYAGLAEFIESLGRPSQEDSDNADGGRRPRYIFGSDGRTRVADTTAYPYRAVGKQWQRYGTSMFVCSGAMIGPYHWLTAGHCVHQGSGGSWADDITISAGQDGMPLGGTRSDDQFYGEADWQYVRSFSGWTSSGDWNWDIAVVTLDRNLGNSVGWLAFGWNTDSNFYNNSNFTTSGYPGDLNNSTLGLGQYTQTGNPRSFGITTDLLRTNTMDVWPGQSGSSVWSGGTTNPVSYGVTSHQTTIGGTPAYNAFTRITEGRFNSIQSWRTADNTERPPTDRADLVDYDDWFNTNLGTVSATSLTPGQSFSATVYPRNNGTAASGNFTVRFRLSTDSTYDTGDYFVGDAAVTSINPFSWRTAVGSLTVPTAIPTGTYRLVYSIDALGNASEYLENNNTASLPNSLIVSNDTDDQISEAVTMTVGATRTASISPGYDVDMFAVTVADGQKLGIDVDRTSGSPLDSYLRLFSASGAVLAFNDDAAGPAPEGSGLESFIEYTFTTGGTYYIGVSGYGNSNYSPTTGFGDANGSTGGYQLILHDLGVVDADDQISEATTLVLGNSRTGQINPGTDVDLYAIAVDAGRVVGFDIDRTTGSLDSWLRLFDSNGNQLAFSDDNVGPAPEFSSLESYIEYTFTTAGTYYVGVSGYANSTYNPLTGDGDTAGSVGGYELIAHDLGLENDPPTDIVLSNDIVIENTSTSSALLVGDLSADDPNTGDAHTFELIAGTGDEDNGVFEISAGNLFVQAGVMLDFESQPSYSIRVRATDGGGLAFDKILTITVQNLAEVDAIVIGDGTVQRSRVESLTVEFDSDVIIDDDAFVVNRRGTGGGRVDVSVATSVIDGRTVATLTFAGTHTLGGSLVDGNYDLQIIASLITDQDGNEIDGDRDGSFGGDHLFGDDEADGFFRMFGDTNGDRVVALAEFNLFRNTFGKDENSPGFNRVFDFDGDGMIGLQDFNEFRRRFGTTL